MFQELHHARRHVTHELSDYFRPARTWHRGRVVAAIGLLLFVVVAALVCLRHPSNLALKQRATSSSAGFDTSAAGAVDGLRYGQLGFHSNSEGHPWLLVDLGAVHSLNGVAVFGRVDCCFNQSIPLLLELSRDGEHFETAARRETPFSQFDPWEVKLTARQARYVRLRADKNGLLVLSEIEVYGR